VILSHAEILSRRRAFAKQNLLLRRICDVTGVLLGTFPNTCDGANAVREIFLLRGEFRMKRTVPRWRHYCFDGARKRAELSRLKHLFQHADSL